MVLRVILLFCALIGLAWSRDIRLDDLWNQFIEVHEKKYDQGEEAFRRMIWEEHVDMIRQHNLEYDMGLHTFTMGINQYTDLSWEEYKAYLLGARRELNSVPHQNSTLHMPYNYNVPDSVDWRTEGYVTPVKDQGQCGSCWAFSSTGALEGQHFRATGKLVSLSEQQLVDCCSANAGCNGGWMDNAFQYVKHNGGLDTEEYYPYQAVETGRCSYNPSDSGTDCTGFKDINRGDEDALKTASATVGPIAVAIDASHQSFQMYRSGIYVEPDCSSTATDHAVLVVGYGSDDGSDYWLVKNSWGLSWGDQGYIKMARNQNNMCAIATFASYPTV